MTLFLYASPILPKKADFLYRLYQQTQSDATIAQHRAFLAEIGLVSWHMWLHRSSIGEFLLQGLEVMNGDSLAPVFQTFRTLLAARHPQAVQLHALFLEMLGRDYRDLLALPKIIAPFARPLATPAALRGEVFFEADLIPLLPTKLYTYRRFCQHLIQEKKDFFDVYCRCSRIIRWCTWIQRGAHQDFILLYRVRMGPPPGKRQQTPQEMREKCVEYNWFTDRLMEYTGMPFENIEPTSHWLTASLMPKAEIHVEDPVSVGQPPTMSAITASPVLMPETPI